jgi:long-chain acyl-CoA synthetase
MLWKMLRQAAGTAPDRVIFSEGQTELRLEQLAAQVSRVAGRLTAEGVQPGDNVGLLVRGGCRTAASIYGVLAAGATVVPLNPASRPGEVARALGPCRPKMALCEPDLAQLVDGICPRTLAPQEVLDGPPGGQPWSGPGEEANRPAFFLFSTGSTGRPKRVKRTHAMMVAEAEQYQAGVRLTPDDRVLGVAPLFHSYGICCVMLSCVRSGASARLFGEFQPDIVMAEATRLRATVLAGSPFHYSIMSQMRPRAGTDLSSIRWAISCGAPAPAQVLEKVRERLGLCVRQLYGASEVGSVSLNVASDPVPTALSAGTPLPGVQVRIVREDGSDAAAGQVGEVAVRSAAGSTAYEDLPEMSARAFREGWFFSGDLGRTDETGAIYITGRVKLLINAGGNKVDPLEVEQVLEEHPAVKEAAVVGAPAAHGLEAVKAVVVLREPADAEALRAHCAERLSGYKVPRILEFRDELPRSPTGKLLRKDLLGDEP